MLLLQRPDEQRNGPVQRKQAWIPHCLGWEAVSAWVCTQCGEPLFEAHEVNHIQRALQQIDRETLELTRQAA